MTKKAYVAYYRTELKRGKKHGWSLPSQKAIVEYFTKQDQAKVVAEFIDEGAQQIALAKAIAYCLKHQVTLIVATLDVLADQVEDILTIKKQLKHLFKSCDTIKTDSFSLALSFENLKRLKQLYSISIKAGIQTQQTTGKTFGNTQNLTAEGRKIGLKKMKNNITKNGENQKVKQIIQKCRQTGMGR